MKISVIGLGYLGAVHAASMAKLGHDVVGVDVDAHKVETLSHGKAPFYEPGFDELLAEPDVASRLKFSVSPAAISSATVHFLCVGTPQKDGELAADVTYVDAAVQSIVPFLKPGDTVVGKSTVPVGTARRLADAIAAVQPEATLVWNPEFLREGYAVKDTIEPDRFVYGVPDGEAGHQATAVLDTIYARAIAAGTPRLVTNYPTAELVKVAANSFLATKISFINAMAEVCENVGGDVTVLADAIGHDSRIGRRFLNAGVGFGGGCLPKDIRAFRARSEELGIPGPASLLREVDAINARRRDRVVNLATNALAGNVEGKKITVLGVTFKPDSDDIRDSPALDIASRLANLGANITATDPRGISNAQVRAPGLMYEPVLEKALAGAECVLLLTEWAEYKELLPVWASMYVAHPVIVDGRDVLDPKQWRAAGWTYFGLGR